MIYWSFVNDEQNMEPFYVATGKKLKPGEYIKFIETLGFIEKQKDGTWSAYSSPFNFLGNDRTKKFAMKLVEKYNKEFEEEERRLKALADDLGDQEYLNNPSVA